jgi:aspartate aminotransferase
VSEQPVYPLSDLAENLTESEIIKLAWDINARIARGERIFNMTIGDFNSSIFKVPNEFIEEVNKAYEQGFTNYPPADGLPQLRKAVAAYLNSHGGFNITDKQVLIAGGGRPMVYISYLALCNPGEKVVYGVPSWNNNNFSFLRSVEAVEIETRQEDDFLLTADQLAPHLSDAAMVALCSPLNPTGTAYSAEELTRIGQLILAENHRRKTQGRKPVYILYDQIYWTLTYGGLKHVHPAGLLPELADFTVYVDGISKSLAATGVRVGWAVGPEYILQKMKGFSGHIGSWAPKPEQAAAAAYLSNINARDRYHQNISDMLESRLSRLYNGIHSLKEKGFPLDAIAPQAALYLSVRFAFTGRQTEGKNILTAEDISDFLLNKVGFAAVPFKSFGAKNVSDWFRVSVGNCSLEDIDEILQKLETAMIGFANQ